MQGGGVSCGVGNDLLFCAVPVAKDRAVAQTGVGQLHNRQRSQTVRWLTGGPSFRHEQPVNQPTGLAAGGLSVR